MAGRRWIVGRTIWVLFVLVAAGAAYVVDLRDAGAPAIAHAAGCDIDANLADTVETFWGRCCKGSTRSVMPSPMWSRTVGDVKVNRSKNDDYRTAWKIISRSEYRK